jgi:electron transport complex protein RnfE
MSSSTDIRNRIRHGLWTVNPGLVQLLGLCPLLAVTTTLVNGLALGIATLFVITFSNMLVSATRHLIRREIRIPLYVLIISSLVTCIEMLFYAWFPGLGRTLGIFLPLIVTNCAIIARAEVYASRNPVLPSIVDGISMGTGFALLLCSLGAFREFVGFGTLFSRFDMLFGGDPSPGLMLFDGGFLLAILPPGAFMALAFAIAAKNAIDRRKRLPHQGSTGKRLSTPA